MERSLGALLLGAFSIAGLHALIPSHWLAFVIVGRAQRWTTRRTLTVTLLAGAGHILMTIVLGLLLAVMGKALAQALPPAAEHLATSVLLILLGFYFAWPTVSGHGRHCAHDHNLDEKTEGSRGLGRRIGQTHTVVGALVLGMTLSPCLDLLSVYVVAARFPWFVLVAVSLIMAITTLTIMAGLVWLTWNGLRRVNLGWIERNEGLALGGLLILLGIALFFL